MYARSERFCCSIDTMVAHSMAQHVNEAQHVHGCAGRDLPPLFNWQKGELDAADPALMEALQPRDSSSNAAAS